MDPVILCRKILIGGINGTGHETFKRSQCILEERNIFYIVFMYVQLQWRIKYVQRCLI